MKLCHSKFLALLLMLLGTSLISSADPATTQLLSAGRVGEVISVLSNRNDAESLNQLSRAYYAMERWDEAIKYGERAVALQPQEASYHLWLAREYGRKAGSSNPLLAATLARKAKNEFERAVQLDSSNVQARVDLSRYYVEAPAIMGGGLDRARDQAQQVAKYSPAMSHLILAQVAAKQKRDDEAESQFQQAIRLSENPADYWLQLGDFYRSRGRSQDMQQAVRTAAMQSHKPAEVYFDAATLLSLGGSNFSDTAQYLEKYLASGELVESAPAFRAHYLLGQVYEKLGRPSDAVVEYHTSLALASGFEPATRALGKLR